MRRLGTLTAAIAALVAALWLGAPAASAKGPMVQLADGARGVWVASGTVLVRVDPRRGRVASVVANKRSAPVAVAVGRGYAWALDGRARALYRVDQAHDRIEARARLGINPTEVAVTSRLVWVLGYRHSRPAEWILLRLDPRSLRPHGAFHLGPRATRLTAGHGAVWLALDPRSPGGRLGIVAIDEDAARLRLRRRFDGYAWAIESGRAGVWLLSKAPRASRPRAGESLLRLVDPRAGTVRRSIRGPFGPGDLAAGSDLIWVTSPCGPPDCNVAEASVRAYDEASGRPVAGPFRPICRRLRHAWFLSGIAALGDGAALAVGDGSGRLGLVIVLARRGVIRCVPV